MDVVTVMAELQHLLVIVRQAELAYDELNAEVKLAIQQEPTEPTQLRRLVPILASYPPEIRQHLTSVLTSALSLLGAPGGQPLRLVEEAGTPLASGRAGPCS